MSGAPRSRTRARCECKALAPRFLYDVRLHALWLTHVKTAVRDSPKKDSTKVRPERDIA